MEGEVKGQIRSLFTVLTGRSIAIDGPTRQRILDESDPHQLDRWIGRALTATTIADVLSDD